MARLFVYFIYGSMVVNFVYWFFNRGGPGPLAAFNDIYIPVVSIVGFILVLRGRWLGRQIMKLPPGVDHEKEYLPFWRMIFLVGVWNMERMKRKR